MESRAMSSAVSSGGVPNTDEVKRIASMTDPVLRNLRITECYHRLSVAMSKRTGLSANWCTFATWASKQAGQTIRGEDLLDKLTAQSTKDAELLHPVRSLWAWLVRRGLFRPETRLGRIVHTIHSPFDAFEMASDAVARGNRKVFEEIGLEFARYLDECPPDIAMDSDAFRSFQQGLREGDPPEGQRLLRLAFERYQRQSARPVERDEGILLANLQIGLHEQTRLQPEIQEAMEAGPDTADDLGERILKAFFPGIRFGFFSRWVAALLHMPASRFRKYMRDLTRRIVTESLMRLAMPRDLRLDLHLNIQRPFPEALVKIRDAALLELLDGFEPIGEMIDDCGATDWSDLKQRFHFIIHLFRAFQEHRDLFDAPFTAEQVRALMDGKVPAGDL
jgi:hypothetical protein